MRSRRLRQCGGLAHSIPAAARRLSLGVNPRATGSGGGVTRAVSSATSRSSGRGGSVHERGDAHPLGHRARRSDCGRRAAALVYDELRSLATQKLGRETPGRRFSPPPWSTRPTCAWSARNGPWDSRGHSSPRRPRRCAASWWRTPAAKEPQTGRRPGAADLDVDQLEVPELREDLLALDEALDRLAEADPEAARLVQLRYFAGLTLGEAAKVLDVSPRTADRLWAYARAWLHQALEGGG